MTRKIRPRQEVVPIRAQVEIVRLYEELSSPWRLGSADPTPPVDWDQAIFGDRKRRYVATAHRPVAPIRAEVEIVRLYEELSPPWRLGSADPTPPVDWDQAIFGVRKRPYVATHIGRNTI